MCIFSFFVIIMLNNIFTRTSKGSKTRYLSYFGSILGPLNALSFIMAHDINHGLLSEYLSSVYTIKD